MNEEINIKIAKLLKEKGFDLPAKGFYYSEEFKTEDIRSTDNMNHNSHVSKFSAPTIAQVIMWLYKKHKIWIEVIKFIDHASDVNDGHTFKSNYTFNKEFNSPTEAYSSAITHILNNLI